MEVLGNSAVKVGALHGSAPHAAAVPEGKVPNALFPDAAFPFGAVLDGWFTGEVFLSDDEFAAGGFLYDDYLGAVVPEDPFPGGEYPGDVFPEDLFPGLLDNPFLELRSKDHLFADASGAAKTLLRADLSADGPGLIDQTKALEKFKRWATGQQVRLAVEFEARQRQEQAELATGTSPSQTSPGTLSAEDLGRKRPKEHSLGVAEQIALARGESPHRGGRLLGMAKALVIEMPHTLGALDSGQLNEEKAMYVVKETACLAVEDRAAVDEELAADTGTFDGVGTRRVIAAVKAAATRRDPRSVTQRASHAASERSVSLRPAPDCMTYLTALLPAHQGVAVYKALTRQADALKSAGDPRSLGQIKADSLVEWTTGMPGGITGIDINLVMTDRTLLQADSEPARLTGYGIVPAEWARDLINDEEGEESRVQPATGEANASDSPTGKKRAATGQTDPVRELKVWLRRLYTAPDTGDLVGMDSKRRLFPPPLRRFIQVRDDTCRTPYCDAPIRHHDHIVPWHDDGPTSLANGAGLCEACNHTKELPGWKAQPRPGPRHTIEFTTPTGHIYRSMAPPLPGSSLRTIADPRTSECGAGPPVVSQPGTGPPVGSQPGTGPAGTGAADRTGRQRPVGNS
ncbi:HNH endonuclease [Arthrobacter sp. NPDC058097]|uniref:HNH endonuclease n=1 Tax=Arthrobacter sp. NPDC058097 TaxID=3346340 RepID=UPI0036DB78FB